MALFSLSKIQLRTLKEKFPNAHQKIRKLLSNPSGLLIVLLFTNEVVNISLTALITKSVPRSLDGFFVNPGKFSQLPDWALASILGTFFTTPIVLILCELTPKIIGVRVNQLIAPLTVNILSKIHFVVTPVRVTLQLVLRFLKPVPSQKRLSKKIGETEFLVLLEEGRKEGSIDHNEIELIRNLFNLDDTSVQEIMTPILSVFGVSPLLSLSQAKTILRRKRFSRIPVFSIDNSKQIIGVLYAKDLLLAKSDNLGSESKVEDIMKQPLFLPLSSHLNTVFRRMRKTKNHLAIIENEMEEAVGIVTMNDVLDTFLREVIHTPEETLV